MKKTRLDIHLAGSGLSVSREKAKREIISGWVRVNGETVRDPSRKITGAEDIRVKRPRGIFVSRGGEKLARALDFFSIDVSGLIAADLGASTGGFTDCLLKNGASFVFAFDVGYGQLDYSLRVDQRVKIFEKFNVKNLTPGLFDRKVDFVTADLSFISILKAAPSIASALQDASGIFLIKPQFEAGKNEQKKGVVRDPEAHRTILRRVIKGLESQGYISLGLTWSPFKGPSGNIEYLYYFTLVTPPRGETPFAADILIDSIVADSHSVLNPEE